MKTWKLLLTLGTLTTILLPWAIWRLYFSKHVVLYMELENDLGGKTK
jgi:hypothetical protein